MTRIQISPDLSLDAVEHGDGPLSVLIAGGFMDMDQWQPVDEALSGRSVRYDQRGVGDSDHPTEGYTIDQFADDAIALIQTLDAGPALLIGNSLGGTVAMAVALKEPSLVRGLVLCATSAGPQGPPTPPESMQRMMRGASLPVEQAALAIMDILFATDFMDEHPEMLDAAIEKRLKGAPMIATLGPLQSALIFDPLEQLRSFAAPALILHGEDDELVLPVHAELLAEAIPNANAQIIADAGHAMVVEQSEAVVAAIGEFVSGL